MPKSRSNAIVLPSFVIDGHSTRPSLNEVRAFAPGTAAPRTPAPRTPAPGTAAPGTAAPGTPAPGAAAPGTAAPGTAAPDALQMFCAPDRSDMKNSVFPSPLHIGHASFDPPDVIAEYVPPAVTIQISLSSRWLCPFRHHCDPAFARAVIATGSPPAGEGAAKYSVV